MFLSKAEVFLSPAAGPGWTASFEDAVNSKAPGPSAAVDVGSSVWDSASPQRDSAQIEDKGWAKFTDFQPFCW